MSQRIIDLIPSQHGHFRLESGYHAEFLLDTRPFLESEQGVARISDLAERIKPHSPTAICGPIAWGAEVASQIATILDCKFIFACRKSETWKKGVLAALDRNGWVQTLKEVDLNRVLCYLQPMSTNAPPFESGGQE